MTDVAPERRAEQGKRVEEAEPVAAHGQMVTPVPPLLAALHRSCIFFLLCGYFFVAFAAARGLVGGWGLPLRVWVPAAFASALMSVFVIWLAPFLALPEIWYRHVLPERRVKRGRCPDCGHPHPRSVAEHYLCPECGGTGQLPPVWQCTWPVIRRFLVLLVAAYLVGSIAAAFSGRWDERRFERDVARRRSDVAFERPRAWPAEFARLRYEPGVGFASTTFVDSEPIVGWRPRTRP